MHSLPELHVAQAAPPLPHSAFVFPASQTLPLQHPFAQLVALHTQAPLTHAWPVAHPTQAPPFAPHCEFVAGVTHVVPLQQPVAQSVDLQ